MHCAGGSIRPETMRFSVLATRFSRSGVPWLALALALTSAPFLIGHTDAGPSARDGEAVIGKAATGIKNGARAVSGAATAVAEETVDSAESVGEGTAAGAEKAGEEAAIAAKETAEVTVAAGTAGQAGMEAVGEGAVEAAGETAKGAKAVGRGVMKGARSTVSGTRAIRRKLGLL